MRKLISIITAMIALQANAQNVGIGTSVPKARLHVADSAVFFSSPEPFLGAGTSPAETGGIGMLWVAGKAALRVGREMGAGWAYDNIGAYSAGFGFNNNLTGVGSFASGNANTVSNTYSIALGSYNYARNQRSLAFGNYSRALGDYSNAIGFDVAALPFQSTAVGRFNVLSGNPTADLLYEPLFVVGNGTADNNRSNALSILKDGRAMLGSDSLTAYQLYVKSTGRANAVFAESNSALNYSTAVYAKNGSPEGNGLLAVVTGAGAGTVLSPSFNLNAIAGYGYGNATAVAASSAGGIAVDAQSISGYAILSYGKLKFEKIGHAAGKILVSDATGEATWQNPSKITLDQPSTTGQSAVEFRNQGGYVGSFGWSEASLRYFLYDGNTNTNPLVIKDGRVGMGDRNPTTNMLEVNGNASKSTAGDWLANSDARLKKNIAPISGALNKIQQLQGVTYLWNDDKTGINRPATPQMGFTAQNIQQVFPELVSKDAQGFLQTGYGTYDALYVEAIKELMKKIDLLEEKIKVLEQK